MLAERTHRILALLREGLEAKHVAAVVGTSVQWVRRVRMRDLVRSIPDGNR